MSHDMHGDHDHHGHGHAPAVDFSDAEWQQLQTEDLKAGKAVVGLMAAIFVIGIVLYTIVAISIVS